MASEPPRGMSLASEPPKGNEYGFKAARSCMNLAREIKFLLCITANQISIVTLYIAK